MQLERRAINNMANGHTLLSVGADRVGLVGLLDESLTLLIRVGVFLSLRDHPLNVLVAETRRRSNSHRLILVGRLVLSINVDNTI